MKDNIAEKILTVGKTLHWYRRGHGFKSHSNLNFFSFFFGNSLVAWMTVRIFSCMLSQVIHICSCAEPQGHTFATMKMQTNTLSLSEVLKTAYLGNIGPYFFFILLVQSLFYQTL